jgi:hypothetical protein
MRGGVPARGRQGKGGRGGSHGGYGEYNDPYEANYSRRDGNMSYTITSDFPAGDPRAAADMTAAVTRGGRTAEDAAMIGGGSPTEATDAGSQRYSVIFFLCR